MCHSLSPDITYNYNTKLEIIYYIEPLPLKIGGGGQRARRLNIAIALVIWFIAIICGIPALIGSYVKVFILLPTLILYHL